MSKRKFVPLPADVYHQFSQACYAADRSMSRTLEKLVRAHIEQQEKANEAPSEVAS